MASPVPALSLPEQLKCQTPDCPNAISVVICRLEDSEADMLCMTCNMAFWLRVLQQATEEGVIPGVAQTAPTA